MTQAPDISPFLAEAATAGTRLSRGNTSFLDLGTGNGSFLFALRQEGWDGVMVGVDYASESLVLARGIWEGILQDEGDDGEGEGEEDERDEDGIVASRRHIEFRYLNVLTLAESGVGLPEWMPVGGYDVVLDKGTFDAVSLSGDCDLLTGRRIVELYAHAAKRLMKKPYGRMVVTSCNWTESELESWFCGGVAEDEKLKVIEKVPYRKFQFGGREGSVVVGLVFGWSLDE